MCCPSVTVDDFVNFLVANEVLVFVVYNHNINLGILEEYISFNRSSFVT